MRIDPSLRRKILSTISPHELLLCYQCGECTTVCPVAKESLSLFHPRKIIEMANLGIRKVVEDDMIWRCTTCYECVEYCPQGVNFVSIILALRNIAREEGKLPKDVRKEIDQIVKTGFILPVTGLVRRQREGLGLPLLEFTESDELKAILDSKKREDEGGKG